MVILAISHGHWDKITFVRGPKTDYCETMMTTTLFNASLTPHRSLGPRGFTLWSRDCRLTGGDFLPVAG